MLYDHVCKQLMYKAHLIGGTVVDMYENQHYRLALRRQTHRDRQTGGRALEKTALGRHLDQHRTLAVERRSMKRVMHYAKCHLRRVLSTMTSNAACSRCIYSSANVPRSTHAMQA